MSLKYGVIFLSGISINKILPFSFLTFFPKKRLFHDKERNEVLKKLNNNRLDIVITTHETCRSEIEKLKDIDWNGIIVDEV